MLVGDTNGGGGDSFYENYLRIRASKRLTGGTYLAPDSHPGDPRSKKKASPEVYVLGNDVAAGQDSLGGRASYKMVNGKKVYVQTAGEASVTIYAASDTEHQHPLETIYTGVVISQGDAQHAEQLSIDAIAAKIKKFIAQNSSSATDFQFDINVMAGLSPCNDCKKYTQWEDWQYQIEKAIWDQVHVSTGNYPGLYDDPFRLRMWFLTGDSSSPRGSHGEDTLSAFHIWHDTGWPWRPPWGHNPGIRFPEFPE